MNIKGKNLFYFHFQFKIFLFRNNFSITQSAVENKHPITERK